MEKLPNEKHELFCLEYLKDLNATQAYLRVYDCKLSTADTNGPRLLGDARVSKRIEELFQERSDRLKMEADDVLRELSLIGRQDIGKLYDENGDVIPIHELPEEIRKTISSVEMGTTRSGKKDEDGDTLYVPYVKKIKFWSKDKALENLGRHHNLFTDKLEISGKLENLSDDEIDERIQKLTAKKKNES